jgi:hypothetical protein
MNIFGYLEEVLLFFKDLLCNSYLLSKLELCSMLTLVYMVFTFVLLLYFKHLVHNMVEFGKGICYDSFKGKNLFFW